MLHDYLCTILIDEKFRGSNIFSAKEDTYAVK